MKILFSYNLSFEFLIVWIYYLFILVICVDAAGCEDGQDCYIAEGATQGECKSSTDETIDLQKRNSLNFHHLIYGFTFILATIHYFF